MVDGFQDGFDGEQEVGLDEFFVGAGVGPDGVEAEQVADDVGVFGAIQAVQARCWQMRTPGGRTLVDALFQTPCELLHHLVLRPLLAHRRHHAGAQALDHFLADIRRVGDGGGIGGFQVDTTSPVNGVVTLGAVLVEQRTTVHTAALGGGLCANGGAREQ